MAALNGRTSKTFVSGHTFRSQVNQLVLLVGQESQLKFDSNIENGHTYFLLMLIQRKNSKKNGTNT